MEHTWHECKRENCFICDGGLGSCTVCDGFEGTLTSDCCGRKLTQQEQDAIYKDGTLDFIDGQWVNPEEPDQVPSPILEEV